MDNIQFEISHDRVLAIIAKQIDVQVDQVTLTIKDEGPGGSVIVAAIVRTDLAQANKIDRKLKRLGETEQEPVTQEPQVRHG